MKKWIEVPNSIIRSRWYSPETSEEAYITPDWYEQNGTPIDSNGNDMEYAHTEILVDL